MTQRKGTGHIQERGELTWQIFVEVGRDPKTGRRRRIIETVKGPRRLAQARVAQLLTEVSDQSYTNRDAKRLTVAQYLDRWLANYAEVRCAPKTVESYRYVAHHHIVPEIGALRLAELTADHLQALYRHKQATGLSPRTVRYCHTLMRQVLAYAVRQDVLIRNVADATDPPRMIRKEKTILALEDVDRFLDAARGTPYFAVFYVLLHTGLRRNEALALRWRNVDLGIPDLGVSGYVSVAGSLTKLDGKLVVKEPKTKSGRRRVPLSPSCALVLRQHREEQKSAAQTMGAKLTDDAFMFCRPTGEPFDPSTVSKAFEKTIRRASLPPMPLHGLRHTHASWLLASGENVKVVQERLGHASVRETMDTYASVIEGMQEAASAKFDALIERARQHTPPHSASRNHSANVSEMSAAGVEEDSEGGEKRLRDEGKSGRGERI